MKKIFLFSLLFLSTLNINSQDVFDAFFETQKSGENTMKLNLEGDFVNFFLQSEMSDNDDFDIKSEIEQLKLLIYDQSSDNSRLIGGLLSSFKTEGYETLIQVRNDGNKIEVFSKDNGDVITSAFAYIQGSDSNLILAKLTGKIRMEDIQKMMTQMNKDNDDDGGDNPMEKDHK